MGLMAPPATYSPAGAAVKKMIRRGNFSFFRASKETVILSKTRLSSLFGMILNKQILRLSWCLLFICATYATSTCQERGSISPADSPIDSLALFPIEVNSRWGYMDRSGKTVIEPRFDWADDFSEGLAAVKVGELWGFIDTNGKLVIEARYSSVYQFSEGLARVQIGGYGKPWGFIDHTGVMVIEPRLADTIGGGELENSFHDGLARIEVNSLHGFIDKKGNTSIAPRFRYAYPFSEGLAAASEGLDKKWGYIDKYGNWAIPPKFDQASVFFDGLAPVELNGACGYVDRTGALKISPRFKMNRDDDCAVSWGSFEDGLSRWKDRDKYGYINKAGEFVIKPQFHLTFNFSEGLAFVEINGKYGFVDTSGRMAIAPQFYSAKDFNNGLAKVDYSRQGWGYIDKRGEFVWKRREDTALDGETNNHLQPGHTRDVLFAGWSADGNLLASYSADGRIKIWNASEGRLMWDIDASDLTSDPLRSPDGRMLASLTNDVNFEIRDAQSRELIWSIKANSTSPERVVSPDGLTIAERGSYGDACVMLRDAKTNELKRRLEGHPGIVFGLAFGRLRPFTRI